MCAPGVPGGISHGVPRSSSASSRALAVVTPIDSGVAFGTESTQSSWMRSRLPYRRYDITPNGASGSWPFLVASVTVSWICFSSTFFARSFAAKSRRGAVILL